MFWADLLRLDNRSRTPSWRRLFLPFCSHWLPIASHLGVGPGECVLFLFHVHQYLNENLTISHKNFAVWILIVWSSVHLELNLLRSSFSVLFWSCIDNQLPFGHVLNSVLCLFVYNGVCYSANFAWVWLKVICWITLICLSLFVSVMFALCWVTADICFRCSPFLRAFFGLCSSTEHVLWLLHSIKHRWSFNQTDNTIYQNILKYAKETGASFILSLL